MVYFSIFEEIVQLKDANLKHKLSWRDVDRYCFLSSGLITYSSLYRSEETRYLLTLPISGKSIDHHKLLKQSGLVLGILC